MPVRWAGRSVPYGESSNTALLGCSPTPSPGNRQPKLDISLVTLPTPASQVLVGGRQGLPTWQPAFGDVPLALGTPTSCAPLSAAAATAKPAPIPCDVAVAFVS